MMTPEEAGDLFEERWRTMPWPGNARESMAELLLEVAHRARVEALREAGQLVRDHVFGDVDAGLVADFLDNRAARLD